MYISSHLTFIIHHYDPGWPGWPKDPNSWVPALLKVSFQEVAQGPNTWPHKAPCWSMLHQWNASCEALPELVTDPPVWNVPWDCLFLVMICWAVHIAVSYVCDQWNRNSRSQSVSLWPTNIQNAPKGFSCFSLQWHAEQFLALHFTTSRLVWLWVNVQLWTQLLAASLWP